MKLEYNIETLLFHLKHIKRMCLENEDCTGCPFNLADEWGAYCLFAGHDFDDGVIPEDWEISELEKEGDEDGC